MGLMVVFTNAAPGRDDEFNRWYDEVHVGEVLAVPPVKSCTRFKVSDVGDEPPAHRYLALYEFEGDPKAAQDALMSASASFNMTDALADPQLIMVEKIADKVEAP